MTRFVAFLRGVSPMNCRMADLKRCLEEAGYSAVKTVLSSGNVAFDANARSTAALERELEATIEKGLGRRFFTIVRRTSELQALVKSDPFTAFDLPADAKPIITFLPKPADAPPGLPIERDGAAILTVSGGEVFSAYTPNPNNPVFMTLLEKTFGKDITTRTFETVRKCAAA